MNVIKLMGGLGNQLFQYAFGKAMRTQVAYDHSLYNNEKELKAIWPRLYRLDKFNVEVPFSSFRKQNTVHEHKIGYDMNLLSLKDSNFIGYWQYANYYRDIRKELQKEFTVKDEYLTEEYEKWKKILLNDESVGVHVRRGDYVRLKGWVLPKSYYFEAINSAPKGPLFIFSDEIKWCKSLFKPEYFSRKIYFVGLEDYLDFGLLRHCQHIILSASSFSWWPAFLNDSGKVICPTVWLGEEKRATLLCLEEWIQVC